MATVNIDDELIEKVESLVQKDKIEYPSIKNFVNKAVKEKVTKLEGDSNDSNSKTIVEL